MEPISYHITEDDYVAFQKMIAARGVPRFVLFMVGLVVLASLIVIAAGAPEAILGAATGGLIGATGLPLIARWTIIPIQARRSYREYDLIQQEMTLSLTDEGFAISQASGRVAMTWDSVAIWNENNSLLTLHPTKNLAYILPKHSLGDAHIAFIRQCLGAHGLSTKGKRRK